MKMRTQKTFTFLLLLSFLFADVSESAFNLRNLFKPVSNAISAFSVKNIPSLTLKFPILSKLPKPIASIDHTKLDKIFKKIKHVKIDAKDFPDYRDAVELLQSDGYLNFSFLKTESEDESVTSLLSAITKIQENYNLPVTGKPDQDTINFILKPHRCSVPDIINGINKVTKFVNKPTSFKPWWNNDKKILTYAILPRSLDIIKPLFQDAFNRWSSVTKLKFTETMSYSRSDISIVFLPAQGKGRVVGGTNISDSRALVYLYLSKETYENLESAVMHQIGHLLGLEHSPVKDAIMYPILSPKKKIEFAKDDLQRIKQMEYIP